MIILRQPLKDIYITQPFGVNYANFYEKLGLKGHNGIDYCANGGTELYACHDGVVRYCGTDSGGGVEIDIWNKDGRYKTIYYHLKNYIIKQDQEVKAGELIGYTDNTGQMTTGNHLHLGFKLTDKDGNTIDWNNGYNGATDPAPYIKLDYKGNNLENMTFKKAKNDQNVYLINEEFGTKSMVIDMPTLEAFYGKIEEVDNLDQYLPRGTFVWVDRIIN
jgi:murein DD-endopeptidase MepM/ murein hydrolase activator NlpD